MTQLPIPSLPGLPTSAQVLRSQPANWRTWSSESKLSRFWRQELLEGDLLPMQRQLLLLSTALEEAVRIRCAASARPAIEDAVQQLDLAVLEHQHFLTTLAPGWLSLYEFPAYQSLLRSFREAVRAWQQAVLVGETPELERFRHCELLGWRLLGNASLLIDMFAESVRVADPVADQALALVSGKPAARGLRGLWRRIVACLGRGR
ncbi:MAG: hypothetical protein LBI66_04915 [Burkholderiaceae bacterium]|jgi:hypothetical protein|nr:hypothetical protein [Burkholderiaceae bacterium]